MRTAIGFMLRVVVMVGCAFVFSPLAFSQESEIEKAKRAEMDRRAGDNERRLATWELRMAEVRRPPEKRRDSSLAYTQIREDYKQLQIVNNDLAREASATSALDLNYVEKSVAEIKKRAARLKENLALPEDNNLSEPSRSVVATEARQLKTALVVLDNLVMEFVNSPIFQQTKTVDVQMAIKARRALEGIIGISDQIKKSNEKLKKLTQKTPSSALNAAQPKP
jgi:hypothetical protein